MRFDYPFFRRTGIKVTLDPLRERPLTPPLAHYLSTLYEAVQDPDRSTVERINRALAEFPDVPTLHHYQLSVFLELKEFMQAEAKAREIQERFPDYFFGKISVIDLRIRMGDPKAAKQLLGDVSELSEFLPGREVFHVSEFFAFHTLAFEVGIETGDFEAAKRHLRLLWEWDKDDRQTKQLAFRLAVKRSPLFNRKERASVEVVRPDLYAPTDEEPVLRHPEVQELLLLPWQEMPQRVIDSLAALPRASLVADLQTLLEDSMRRFDYYVDNDLEEACAQASHALALLAWLEAAEALPVVLNTLRYEKEYSRFWFGDFAEHYYCWYLTMAAPGNLDTYRAFARERGRYTFHVFNVFVAVAQWGMQETANRQHAVSWFADLFQYYLDHPDDTGLIDADTISFAISEAGDLRAPELLPLVEQLYGRDWVDPTVMGNMAEIERIYHLPPDPADLKPIPTDIPDLYNETYRKRTAPSNQDFSGIADELEKKLNDPLERYLKGLTSNLISNMLKDGDDDDDWEEDSPPPALVVRKPQAIPSVGQNAPCPCGSGKKYKRCHGKG
jgi:hypothetical protein